MCISLTGWSLLKGHMIEIRMVSVDENSHSHQNLFIVAAFGFQGCVTP